jgi:nucleoside-diphosphate-sugar epimerase
MIGILGANGFIGSNLLQIPNSIGITRENYDDHIGKHYNVFINANGNSSKRLPEIDPLLDFDLSVRNTLRSIIDFKFDTYIYISSCEVYTDETREDSPIDVSKISRYGLSKYLAEQIVIQHCPKWLILRLNAPIGPKMTKGACFDLMHAERIYVAANSMFQFIHINYLIKFIMECGITNEVINIAGKDTISLNEVMKVFGTKVDAPSTPIIVHNFNIEKANNILVVPSALESINEIKFGMFS